MLEKKMLDALNAQIAEELNSAHLYAAMAADCEAKNLNRAYKRVKANRGSPGIDGMTVGELGAWLKAHGVEIPKCRWQGVPAALPVRPTRPRRVPVATRVPGTIEGSSPDRWLP